jgi:hypothetical protein
MSSPRASVLAYKRATQIGEAANKAKAKLMSAPIGQAINRLVGMNLVDPNILSGDFIKAFSKRGIVSPAIIRGATRDVFSGNEEQQ